MKSILSFAIIIFFIADLLAQDSVKVQTFTWDNNSRRGVFQFPDDNSQTYRKILMYYNMRCHGARVGVSGVGCGEWDYSCNTFVTDSSKVDSIEASINNYVISGFNGLLFAYTTQAGYTYYRYNQKDAKYGSVISEQKKRIGNGNKSAALESNDGTFRGQYLFTAAELTAAGFPSGNITGLDLYVAENGNVLPHFRIRIKAVNTNSLNSDSPETEGFTEVYYKDTEFKSAGLKHFQFYKTFNWNGTSSLIIDISHSDFNPTYPPKFLFHDNGNPAFVIASSKKEKSIVWDGLSAKATGSKLSMINNEITISFWSYGTPDKQPSDGSIIEGLDQNNQRSLNIHLPWSNGGIYFDAGNQNGGYDRIEKQAAITDYEAQWIHWAFTKNAQTGEMKIYRNGKLWQSGLAKLNPIQLSSLSIGGPMSYEGPYYGRMQELTIWNKALDSTTINEWKSKSITASHPYYSNLVYYYDMQDANGTTILDHAANPEDLNLPASINRHQERGDKLVTQFSNSPYRPDMQFVQGNYTTTSIDDIPVLDSIPRGPKKVIHYKVENNNLVIDSIFYVYSALYDNILYENGSIAEEFYIEPENAVDIIKLKYFLKTPAKYELISLVTPYGNNLDLGPDGKTFVFDVTDFTPVLKGNRMISMELGGENQEEIDLKFVFIKGIPEREVIDISNVWPFQRGYFSEILSNSRFEARKMSVPQNATNFKLRFSVTGHEQNGEFVERGHFVNIKSNSTKKYPFNVWRTCGDNPIYPQGGTWIFDRAGWCPGAPTVLHTFDISNDVPASKEFTLDYGVEQPQLDQANYLVSSQLVSYGPLHFNTDASIEEILRPSAGRVEYERLNPSCNKPTIMVRNTGKQNIQQIKIRYGIKNGIKEEFIWNGNLASEQNAVIELTVTNKDFWVPGADSIYVFEAELLTVNGQPDEYAINNKKETPFKKVDSYSVNLVFEFRTNNIPTDNNYKIVNSQGVTVIERYIMSAATAYRDELLLPPGCYTIYVKDVSQDGLSFWYYPNNGSGSARLLRKFNNTLIPIKIFNPDFGAGFQYDFIIPQTVATDESIEASLFSITPNPANDVTEIEFATGSNKAATLTISNTEGKIIHSGLLQMENGRSTYKWNISNLEKGMYLIQIIQGKNIISKKFIRS